jgi:V8-like Glu-specific endopeptidase
MKHAINLSAIASAMVMLAAGPAQAQNDVVGKANPDVRGGAQHFWTAERFRAARPFPIPRAAPDTASEVPSAPEGRPVSSEGRAPVVRLDVPARRVYTPDPQPRAFAVGEPGSPNESDSPGATYTSTRVFPMFSGADTPFSADRAFPDITVGKLFFSVGGAPYACSGAVIARRVVATAGHCVHSGTASGFHSNFVFIPAFRDGIAPLGIWHWGYVATTATWAGGGGGVPNAADYAMIEFGDQVLNQGGPMLRLGDVTGWLGWQTVNLLTNHTSKLGYPCNLDNCEKMRNVMSNNFREMAPNNVEYGSDARAGSSGGPWVQKFATPGAGNNVGLNQLVGVTSYIYSDVDPKLQGASILDDRFISLFNLLCRRAGNCN